MKTYFKILFFCFIFLLFAGIYFCYYREIQKDLVPCLFLSILFSFLLVLGCLAVVGAFTELRDRRIIKSAQRGDLLKDGKRCAVLGSMAPLGEPLLAPFSHSPCVAYQYRIYHRVRTTKGTQFAEDFEGWAMTPSVINTGAREVKILSAPDLSDFPRKTSSNYDNANEFIAETTFEKSSLLNIFSVKTYTNDYRDETTGLFRQDLRHSKAENASGLILEEGIVPVGAKVSAIGRYSVKRDGLVKGLRLFMGDDKKLSGALKIGFGGLFALGVFFISMAFVMAYFVNPPMLEFPGHLKALVAGTPPPVPPGQPTFTNSIGMGFMRIPEGSFMMGSPEDEPGRRADEKRHEVRITKPFYLQNTEVTQRQWKTVMESNPPSDGEYDGDCPVDRATWEGAQEFIARLNRLEGTEKYRLPTEAEWEYACRAETTSQYSFGEKLIGSAQYAWYKSTSDSKINPVAQKEANAWGLYDMHGNVSEWCQDIYGEYPEGPVSDPKGPASGASRVERGGSYYSDPMFIRSASRSCSEPHSTASGVGFRVARDK